MKEAIFRAILGRSKTRWLYLAVATGLLVDGAVASALEHGHVRARTRAFVYEGEASSHESQQESSSLQGEADSSSEIAGFEDAEMAGDSAEDLTWEEPESVEEEIEATVEREADKQAAVEGKGPARRVHRWMKKGAGMLLISDNPFKKKGFKAKGYLAFGPPNPLRFSDVDEVNSRPPSPALPEFSFSSEEYYPYLVESPLEEGALGDSSMLSELIIEMEPHTVVSGKIDTRRIIEEETVESFDLEEQQSTVLRPEEVLIFFETDGNMSETNAVIPFSPATPSSQTPKSSAKLIEK